MSEEQNTVAATENNAANQETKATESQPVKEMTFTQDQLDNIIKGRLEAEKKKFERQLADQKKAEEEVIKQKEISEAKTKQDLEKLMQERISEKDNEIRRYKDMMSKEKIDNSILSVASQNKAVSPSQIASLLKSEIKLTDDNRIEIIDQNNNIRYNSKGELLTIEERVKEFLDTNPHFRQGSLSGSGSQSSVEGRAVKPLDISALDFTNPDDREKYREYRNKRDSGAVKINLNK